MTTPKYRAYTLSQLDRIAPLQTLAKADRFALEVVGRVFPFKTSNYVVEELIRWDRVPHDPLYILTFPQRGMLTPGHFNRMATALNQGAGKAAVNRQAEAIRRELNPHPAGQMEHNVPRLKGRRLEGIQHKYRETVLFFPSQGQTCHAYCSFCFRWPQFVGGAGLKFAAREASRLVEYLAANPQVSDLLITGGDPLVMKADVLEVILERLEDKRLSHLKSIRLGSKALSFWPYRFISDRDADQLLGLFQRVVKSGRHLAFMAHFNHPRELATKAVREAIRRIRRSGAEIRTQSPLLAHINDDPAVWAEMWRRQVALGCIPYYMFLPRDTGAQHYFGVSLVRAWEIFQQACQQVSGLARTVRGPSMSTTHGKVQVMGAGQAQGERVLVLQFLQGRNPDWVHRPFFARFDPHAIWFDQLRPAFGETHFFFEEEGERAAPLAAIPPAAPGEMVAG